MHLLDRAAKGPAAGMVGLRFNMIGVRQDPDGSHVPQTPVGGPIALIQDGDVVTIDAEENRIDVALSESEPECKSASEGCVTDE